MSQFENKGQLKGSVDSMKLMLAFIIPLLSKSFKSSFLNKNVLITEIFISVRYLGQ